MYAIYRKIPEFSFNKTLGTILEVAFLVVLFNLVSNDFASKAFWLLLFFALTVLLFAFEAGSISSFLKHKIFLLLGKLSYSIYMVHAAVIFVFTGMVLIFEKLRHTHYSVVNEAGFRFLDLGGYVNNSLITLLILAIVIGLSTLTYKYIELPWYQFGKKK